VISTATISGGCLIREERVIKADLFPEISKELAIEKEKKFEQEREADDQYEERSKVCPDEKAFQKSTQQQQPSITPRAPTEEENDKVLKHVQERFYSIYRDYAKIYNNKNGQIICVTEFQKILTLEPSKREELDFLCAFIHDCKQFVSPVTPNGLPCENISSAIGWSKDTTQLVILPQYRNEESIQTNQEAYSKLMEGSERAGGILWEIFSRLGNVAAEKTRAEMKKLASDGLGSNLAFPSNSFYHDNYQLEREGEDSELPLSFAMMIPTFKSTGQIALESEGHRVNNGQFIFPDIKQAITFTPDTICLMIFRAHEYAHGTLNSTEVGDSTRLGLCVQAPLVISKNSLSNQDTPDDLSPEVVEN
jgi:hypothetical protein